MLNHAHNVTKLEIHTLKCLYVSSVHFPTHVAQDSSKGTCLSTSSLVLPLLVLRYIRGPGDARDGAVCMQTEESPSNTCNSACVYCALCRLQMQHSLKTIMVSHVRRNHLDCVQAGSARQGPINTILLSWQAAHINNGEFLD